MVGLILTSRRGKAQPHPVVGAFANPKQIQIAREYVGYIDKLEARQMGSLRPAEGETLLAVRKRLGMTAKLSGKRLEIRNMKGEIYFWFQSEPRGSSIFWLGS